MKLCEYAQNNSEVYLSTAACFNIYLKSSYKSVLNIFQYGNYDYHLVTLAIDWWKRLQIFPSTIVMPFYIYRLQEPAPIMNRRFVQRKKPIWEDTFQINLI
jgi:hypothetical protein